MVWRPRSLQVVCVSVEEVGEGTRRPGCFILESGVVFQHCRKKLLWASMEMQGPQAWMHKCTCADSETAVSWEAVGQASQGISQNLASRKEISAMKGHCLWVGCRCQTSKCGGSSKGDGQRLQR